MYHATKSKHKKSSGNNCFVLPSPAILKIESQLTNWPISKIAGAFAPRKPANATKQHLLQRLENAEVNLGQPMHAAIWYGRFISWSIDSCQNKVSADQSHITISRVQV